MSETSLYPDGFDNFGTIDAEAGDTLATAGGGVGHDGLHNQERSAINAIEQALGTNPEGTSDVASRLDALDNATSDTRFTPPVSEYSVNPLMVNKQNTAPGLNLMSVYAMWSGPNGVTIDKLLINVTTVGSAGAVARAGIYLYPDGAWPFDRPTPTLTLERDAGTVDTASTTGAKVWDLTADPVVVPANRWFGVAGVHQVAGPAACWREQLNYGFPSPYGRLGGAAPYDSAVATLLHSFGINGALPSSPSLLVTDGGKSAGIAIYRSA